MKTTILPQVKTKRSKLASELENTAEMKEAYNPFKAHMEKVIEVKIYLKYNFHKNDIIRLNMLSHFRSDCFKDIKRYTISVI